MKILNLYAGIGGNRKNWSSRHDVTAVEINEEIANVYSDFFPGDDVVVGDAHKYLKENFREFDFIWSSPPCPSHSKIRNEAGVGRGQNEPVYPDMKLYQEIIFLQRLERTERFDVEYCVENVIPDYNVLIPAQKTQRHLFWSSFTVPDVKVGTDNIDTGTLDELEKHHGFDLEGYDSISHKKKVKMLRNCVHPEIGEAILDACGTRQQSLKEVRSSGE